MLHNLGHLTFAEQGLAAFEHFACVSITVPPTRGLKRSPFLGVLESCLGTSMAFLAQRLSVSVATALADVCHVCRVDWSRAARVHLARVGSLSGGSFAHECIYSKSKPKRFVLYSEQGVF